MSAKDIKTLNEDIASIRSVFIGIDSKLEKISSKLEEIERTHTTADTRLQNLEKIIPDVTDKILERLRIVEQTAPVKNSIDLAEFKNLQKSVTDCNSELRQIQQSQHPSLSSVLSAFHATLIQSADQSKSLAKTTTRLLENTVHKMAPPTDHSFASYIDAYNNWLHYNEIGGHMKFYEYLRHAPNILSMYRKKARRHKSDYDFNPELYSDTEFFIEIIKNVFYPGGIEIDAVKQLVLSKRMTGSFSSMKASAYSLHIDSITTILGPIIPDHLIGACWKEVAFAVTDYDFRFFLLSQTPSTLDKFSGIIDERAKIFADSNRSRHTQSHQDSLDFTHASSTHSSHNRSAQSNHRDFHHRNYHHRDSNHRDFHHRDSNHRDSNYRDLNHRDHDFRDSNHSTLQRKTNMVTTSSTSLDDSDSDTKYSNHLSRSVSPGIMKRHLTGTRDFDEPESEDSR